jgi:hypothetical protein
MARGQLYQSHAKNTVSSGGYQLQGDGSHGGRTWEPSHTYQAYNCRRVKAPTPSAQHAHKARNSASFCSHFRGLRHMPLPFYRVRR